MGGVWGCGWWLRMVSAGVRGVSVQGLCAGLLWRATAKGLFGVALSVVLGMSRPSEGLFARSLCRVSVQGLCEGALYVDSRCERVSTQSPVPQADICGAWSLQRPGRMPYESEISRPWGTKWRRGEGELGTRQHSTASEEAIHVLPVNPKHASCL